MSWQSEPPARPGWQLVVLTAALPENGTLPVELQLPPLLLPLLSIACRCCINIPCQGDCNNCEIHAMFQRHVNFSSGTIKEGNTVPGFSQALKSEKGFFTSSFFLNFFPKGGCFIRVQKSTRFLLPFSWVELFCEPLCSRPVVTHSGYGNGAKVLWAKRIGHSQAQGAWILDVISAPFLCNPLPIHY